MDLLRVCDIVAGCRIEVVRPHYKVEGYFLVRNGMYLPGDENRADDHFASSVCVCCRGKKVYVQWSEESSRNSQSGRQYEDRMSRVYDNTRVSHGQSSKWRRGWCRAERHGFTTPQTLSSPLLRRVHVEEHTLDRVFRRHPLPGALQDLMSQQHSLYGRGSSGDGQIITMGNKNLNIRLTPYLHASISPYLQVLSRQTGNVYFEASSAALMASQLAFASPNNILVLGA